MERTEFVALGYRVEKLVPVGEYWDLLRWECGGWIWIDNVGQATADRIKSEATEVLVSAPMTEPETSQSYYEKKLKKASDEATDTRETE